jgi:hypothetical protein
MIVREVGGRTENAAVDPVASMQRIKNDKLAALANKVRQELKSVIAYLWRRRSPRPRVRRTNGILVGLGVPAPAR